MSLVLTGYGPPFPRRQTRLLVELLVRRESPLRSALLGRRREGKSDLLRQVQAALFEQADGPIPFHYAFDARRDPSTLARHYAASFCQQMRAFGMRQPEMLGEPLARLERELERPGLPLALSELGREFLSLPAAEQLEFAAALPAQFACLEGRPLCLLLDDAEILADLPAFLAYLEDPRLSWLVAGRRPAMARMAAERGWPMVSLEPFTVSEALALAEDRCRQFETPFVEPVWTDWLEMAGTAPAWVHQLIQAAVVAQQNLDSLETLGRTYLEELATGGLGRWLEGRWQRVFAVRSPREDADRTRVAEQLVQATAPAGSGFPPELWEALAAEEWAEMTPLGPQVRLHPIERDWLELALSAARSGVERAKAGVLQAFLLRAEGLRLWRQTDGLLREIRKCMAELPSLASAIPATRGAKELRLPAVCALATERTSTAELYWCYGLRPGWPKERRDRPEAACLYLIAVCRQEPSPAEVKQWSRRLQEEIRALPVSAAGEKSASSGIGPRYELWLALPRSASLAPIAGERRMRWETLAGLLGTTALQAGETLPPLLHLEAAEAQTRLQELEARALWLEEELAVAREQFRKEATSLAAAAPPPSESPPPPAAPEDAASRMALSARLLSAAADLLALQSRNHPVAEALAAEIQQQARKLADAVRTMPASEPLEGPARNPEES